MGLKPQRTVLDTSVDYFMNTAATRGGIVSVSTAGSGVANDQAEAVVAYVAQPSGIKPIGLLLNDVVNLDLTRQKQNVHKDEVQLGSKVTVMRKGTVTTNMVLTGHSPAGGGYAYVGPSGWIAASDVATDSANASTTRIVGRWESSKDEDGYAKVTINLP